MKFLRASTSNHSKLKGMQTKKICGKSIEQSVLFREKIAILKGANENAQILIPKPSSNKAGRLLNSERIIDIIDMHEMRLVKPEVLEMEKRAQRTFGTGAGAKGT